MNIATFGAGCFWGVEAAFRGLPGVIDTRVGYAGGTTPNPSYEDVCTGTTGHTEVVEVSYDPEQITYEELLDVFWSAHDPTAKHKTQYRSVIFYHSPQQQHAAVRAQRPGLGVPGLGGYGADPPPARQVPEAELGDLLAATLPGQGGSEDFGRNGGSVLCRDRPQQAARPRAIDAHLALALGPFDQQLHVGVLDLSQGALHFLEGNLQQHRDRPQIRWHARMILGLFPHPADHLVVHPIRRV